MRNPLPTRRSRRRRAITRGAKVAKAGAAAKLARGLLSRTRPLVALPAVGAAAVALIVNRRLRKRREGGTFDQTVGAPVPATTTPRPVAVDPSPANPETDLPAAPNGSASAKPSDSEETKTSTKAKPKAAVAEADAPNEGAPGHEPS